MIKTVHIKGLLMVLIMTCVGMNTQAQLRKKNQEEPIATPTFRTDPTTHLVTYQGTLKVPGTQQELHDKYYAWFKSYYTSPARLIQTNERDSGLLVVKPTIRLKGTDPKTGVDTFDGVAIYSFTLQASDGEVHFVITQIHWKKTSYFGMEKWIEENKTAYNKTYAQYLIQVDEAIKAAIADMSEAVKQ